MDGHRYVEHGRECYTMQQGSVNGAHLICEQGPVRSYTRNCGGDIDM